MTAVAFYAPMKPPSHPVPSGDRAMARALMQALELSGARVDLASDLRVFDKTGDVALQTRLQAAADAEIARLTGEGRIAGWQAWVTYHCHYKAPDLIGPAVAAGLGIPYVLIEATRADKRLGGPWDAFARAAHVACDAAAAICYLTTHDEVALRQDAPPGQRLVRLAPFLPQSDLPDQSALRGAMLAVGMMRPGDKMASYTLLAQALAGLGPRDWQLQIAGDGAARAAVEALMAPFEHRVELLGLLDAQAMARTYARASMLIWPGVNEAFGLSYLEAQAHGLPVVAQDRPGVRDVLAPGDYPAPEAGPEALTAQITALLDDVALRRARGAAARAYVADHHLMPAASWTLHETLRAVLA